MNLPTELTQIWKSAAFGWSIASRIIVAVVMLVAIPVATFQLAIVALNGVILEVLANGGMIVGAFPALVFLFRGQARLRAIPITACWVFLAVMLGGGVYSIYFSPFSLIPEVLLWALIAVGAIVLLERFGKVEANPIGGDNDTAGITVNLEIFSRAFLGVQGAGVVFILGLFSLMLFMDYVMVGGGVGSAEITNEMWCLILGGLGVLAATFPGVVFVSYGRGRLASTSWAWLVAAVIGLALMAGVLMMSGGGHAGRGAGEALIFLVPIPLYLFHLFAERAYSGNNRV